MTLDRAEIFKPRPDLTSSEDSLETFCGESVCEEAVDKELVTLALVVDDLREMLSR